MLTPLARQLGIPAHTLMAQRRETGLGWGEILIANRIAQQTGTSFGQVVAEAYTGKGWGEIARSHHLDVGALVREVKVFHGTVQHSASAAHRGGAGGPDGGNAPGMNGRCVPPHAGVREGAGAGAWGDGMPGVTVTWRRWGSRPQERATSRAARERCGGHEAPRPGDAAGGERDVPSRDPFWWPPFGSVRERPRQGEVSTSASRSGGRRS